MPTKTELLAHKNYKKMCEYIKADTLKFLSLEGLYQALTGTKEIIAIHNLATTTLQGIIQ